MGDLTRREFLSAAALGPCASLVNGCQKVSPDAEVFRKKFSEMSPAELQDALKRLERRYARRYGKSITVKSTPPREGVVFGYGLDLSRCIGCRRCVYACVGENNTSRKTEIQWIRVLRMEKGGFDLEKGEHYYEPAEVPEDEFFYLALQCQQ